MKKYRFQYNEGSNDKIQKTWIKDNAIQKLEEIREKADMKEIETDGSLLNSLLIFVFSAMKITEVLNMK